MPEERKWIGSREGMMPVKDKEDRGYVPTGYWAPSTFGAYLSASGEQPFYVTEGDIDWTKVPDAEAPRLREIIQKMGKWVGAGNSLTTLHPVLGIRSDQSGTETQRFHFNPAADSVLSPFGIGAAPDGSMTANPKRPFSEAFTSQEEAGQVRTKITDDSEEVLRSLLARGEFSPATLREVQRVRDLQPRVEGRASARDSRADVQRQTDSAMGRMDELRTSALDAALKKHGVEFPPEEE